MLALINIITNSQESYNLPVVKFNTNTEENILSLRIRKTWREESGMDDEGGEWEDQFPEKTPVEEFFKIKLNSLTELFVKLSIEWKNSGI